MTTKKLKNSPEPTGALAERKQADGVRRRIKLTRDERQLLKKQKLAEAAAALFLDMENTHTWAETAAELGISIHQLRDLTKSDLFNEAYSQLFAELGHDPRYKAALGAIGDMLPTAVRRLQELMTGTRVPAAVTMKAIEKVLAINGIENMKPTQSDRADLVKYLEEKGNTTINVNNLNVTVPDEYAQAMQDYSVEAQFRTDTSASSSDNVDTVPLGDVPPAPNLLTWPLDKALPLEPPSSESDRSSAEPELEPQKRWPLPGIDILSD